jgi:hypothetical protein
MPSAASRCPLCHRLLPTPVSLAEHFRLHPECRAHAVLSRSLAQVGVRLCPRCHAAMSGEGRPRWSASGFVHEACLIPGEPSSPLPVSQSRNL